MQSTGQEHARTANNHPHGRHQLLPLPCALGREMVWKERQGKLACLPYSSSPRARTSTASGSTSWRGRACWQQRSAAPCPCCSARCARSRPRRRWPSTAKKKQHLKHPGGSAHGPLPGSRRVLEERDRAVVRQGFTPHFGDCSELLCSSVFVSKACAGFSKQTRSA